VENIFEITINGKKVKARSGQTIATVLMTNGHRICRRTLKFGQARGIYCGMGQCWECIMVVNGRPNIRACMTLVTPNMCVETQIGLGLRVNE